MVNVWGQNKFVDGRLVVAMVMGGCWGLFGEALHLHYLVALQQQIHFNPNRKAISANFPMASATSLIFWANLWMATNTTCNDIYCPFSTIANSPDSYKQMAYFHQFEPSFHQPTEATPPLNRLYCLLHIQYFVMLCTLPLLTLMSIVVVPLGLTTLLMPPSFTWDILRYLSLTLRVPD